MDQRRFLYDVGVVADEDGDGVALKQLLNDRAAHGWQAVHIQGATKETWTIVFEMPAPTPKNR